MQPSAPRTVTPPRQARSRETLERILAATEELLDHHFFDDLTIAQILERAGTSTGSFYARFDGKDALFPHLYERYATRVLPEVERSIDALRESPPDLEARTRALLELVIGGYRRWRGIVRTATLYARARPGEISREHRRQRRRLYDRLCAVLLDCRAAITHPRPEEAVRIAVFFTFSACRDRILFSEAPHPRTLDLDDRTLVDELTRAALAYLTAGG